MTTIFSELKERLFDNIGTVINYNDGDKESNENEMNQEIMIGLKGNSIRRRMMPKGKRPRGPPPGKSGRMGKEYFL